MIHRTIRLWETQCFDTIGERIRMQGIKPCRSRSVYSTRYREEIESYKSGECAFISIVVIPWKPIWQRLCLASLAIVHNRHINKTRYYISFNHFLTGFHSGKPIRTTNSIDTSVVIKVSMNSHLVSSIIVHKTRISIVSDTIMK